VFFRPTRPWTQIPIVEIGSWILRTPWDLFIHTHIYIYIYIYICFCLGRCSTGSGGWFPISSRRGSRCSSVGIGGVGAARRMKLRNQENGKAVNCQGELHVIRQPLGTQHPWGLYSCLFPPLPTLCPIGGKRFVCYG